MRFRADEDHVVTRANRAARREMVYMVIVRAPDLAGSGRPSRRDSVI